MPIYNMRPLSNKTYRKETEKTHQKKRFTPTSSHLSPCFTLWMWVWFLFYICMNSVVSVVWGFTSVIIQESWEKVWILSLRAIHENTFHKAKSFVLKLRTKWTMQVIVSGEVNEIKKNIYIRIYIQMNMFSLSALVPLILKFVLLWILIYQFK